MRPIKFRAWDKSGRRFWTQEEMVDIGGFYYSFGVNPDVDEFDLEQFTGLLDKNGKEIYEGDIVEFYRTSLGTTSPVRHKVEWWDSVAGFNPFTSNHGLVGNEVEVIGNIREKPELLKP